MHILVKISTEVLELTRIYALIYILVFNYLICFAIIVVVITEDGESVEI